MRRITWFVAAIWMVSGVALAHDEGSDRPTSDQSSPSSRGREEGALAHDEGSGRPTSDQTSPSSQGREEGALRKFEKSTQPTSTRNGRGDTQSEVPYSKGHDDNGLLQFALEVVGEMFAMGGRSSMSRILPQGESSSVPRMNGEPLIPFIRYDFAFQRISSDISARSNRIEGGYGPLALYLEDYAFIENNPPSALNVGRLMFLYRMAGDVTEIDVGLGRTVLAGATRTEIDAITVRAKYRFNEHFALDFQPVFGDRLYDLELALSYGQQFGAIKVGYRSLNSPSDSLSGVFTGLAFYY